ncbi:YbhB/YbcL family Raf kinase inhibitor-like protein [Zophobihabitans entericus]|uniref:YbhB/YbcL family Raf kinase inhibitor-like protein n=2 Tax=Zophobihabitans entericus TaxID=1635327 RepID=A0A6G9IF21_9GAMM|nr:YbhB/YbcL family Raf kinase inhibitor-like protein [Zophobihabitans entericus]
MKKYLLLTLSFLSFYSFSQTKDFSLSSPDLDKNGFTNRYIADVFGCEGENISPELTWKNIPAGTKSLAMTMYDPDAPTGSGWWHWAVANIPVGTHSLVQNAGNQTDLLPGGAVTIRNDYGYNTYGGPCPPVGRTHKYQFTIYALSIDNIPVSETSSAAYIGFMVNQFAIDKAQVTYTYGR